MHWYSTHERRIEDCERPHAKSVCHSRVSNRLLVRVGTGNILLTPLSIMNLLFGFASGGDVSNSSLEITIWAGIESGVQQAQGKIEPQADATDSSRDEVVVANKLNSSACFFRMSL